MNKRIFKFVLHLSFLGSLCWPTQALAKGVVLNFNDVDISTMVKFISELTDKNFIMDDRVKGKISVFSPAKLSVDEAFNLFTSVLELKGFTIIEAGKVYKIVPIGSAKQSGTRIISGKEREPVNETYVARLIPLENITSQEAVTFLQPVISKDGYISAFGPSNMLLAVDSSLNLDKVLNILKVIDSDERRRGAEVIFLKNATADSAAKVVNQWVAARASRQPGQPAGGEVVVPDVRLNALLVFGRDNEKEEIKKIVAMVDVAAPQTSGKVNVYYLENADATDVAKVLDGVVKGMTAAPGQPAAPAQQSPFEGGKITITPDKATNALVIMASPADYQNILQVVQKLDRRRRQVFVQAVIAEISPDKLRDLGVQWGTIGAGATGSVSAIGQYDPNNTISTLLSQLASTGITSQNIFSLGRAANFGAILHALDTNGAVNVLSTPNILTSDNKEAEIFVGENVPFITGTNLSSTGLSQQSVERKDTGITLRLTPQISEGEYVKLDIYQEISAVKDAFNKGAAADITTTKRSAKTSVVVKDKDTVVIGGLIQDQDQETVKKIPLLGDIPLLGWFFKTRNTERKKTNLMIVLTPRIIRGTEELAEVSETQKVKFNAAVNNDEPFALSSELQPKGVPGATEKPTGDKIDEPKQ